ncbi:uncharacterized protein LOC134876529 [Eleginops maclovinus]|uniref:uncharacterized protein LOC134876529 n=1 Tax=Eleginops maclovinus TaxID=56733 RepID=UPI00308090AF
MAEIKWSQMTVLLLQITGVATKEPVLSFIVKEGVEVPLPCHSARGSCEQTTWLFSDLGRKSSTKLVDSGQIGKDAKAKADRLSVTDNCSLVVKKVTEEDASDYTCRQIRSEDFSDSQVVLSVVTMTEHQDNDEVTLRCSVKSNGDCRHSVKWLFHGRDVDNNNEDLKTSKTSCSASVTFRTSHFIYTSKRYDLLKCNVTDSFTRKVLTFSTTTETNEKESGKERSDWWLYVVVAVGLAALLIIAVAVVGWRKSKETQIDDRIRLTSNPTVTQSVPKAVRTRRILKRRFSTPRSATQTPTVQPRFWLVKMK